MERMPQFQNPDGKEVGAEMSVLEKEQLISESRTFDQLYDSLKKIGPVMGSQELFNTSRLIGLIERVRNGELESDFITSTYGLRDKVEELLGNEPPDRPDPPSPLEATVALELPKENLDEVEQEPGVGPHPEQPPKGPIEPITEGEYKFLSEVDKVNEYEWRALNDVPEEFNLEYDAIRTRYDDISERLLRWEVIVSPSTFEKLFRALESATVLMDKDGTRFEETPAELLERIKRVQRGEESSDVLPDLVRGGVERLICDSILKRLEQGSDVEISEHEWKLFLKRFPTNDYKPHSWSGVGPEIGSREVYVRSRNVELAKIDGELVWSDKKIAIFKTSGGYRSIPYEDIVLDVGRTQKEIDHERRSHDRGQQLKERQIEE